MKKLRLLLWETCNRTCPGCCNHDWDLTALPVATLEMLSTQDVVILTGGEPLLFPDRLHAAIRWVRKSCRAEVYIYTAKVNSLESAVGVLAAVDGITVTLHEQSDVKPFLRFADAVDGIQRSKQVNVFRGVSLSHVPSGWHSKQNVVWIPNCPLPDGETFVRMPNTF